MSCPFSGSAYELLTAALHHTHLLQANLPELRIHRKNQCTEPQHNLLMGTGSVEPDFISNVDPLHMS